MPQAVKYQTTTIDPWQSAAQIAGLIQKYGGTRYEMRWDPERPGELTGIRFAIRDARLGEVPVILAAKIERVEEILRERRVFQRDRTRRREQAQRIAWRQLKDFIEQALLAVETGLFDLAAAFMAHVEVHHEQTGEPIPLFQYFTERGRLGPEGHGVRMMKAAE